MTTRRMEVIAGDLQALVAEFERKRMARKPQARQWKWLSEQVEKKYLRTFDQTALFADMVEEGRYSGVTLLALYGFLLEDLNIPHHLAITLDRVSLVVFPEGENIVLDYTRAHQAFFGVDPNSLQHMRE